MSQPAPHVIPYTPRPLQWRFHEERSRFCVLLCHRRFGKTVAAVNDLVRQALRVGRDDWRAAYAAPFLGQAKAVAWDYCKRFAGAVPGTRFLESELVCVLPTGGRIRLLGTENAQALRGLYLDDLVLDEPADMPRQVWTQVLRPMLADRQGRALFCGTPQGTDNLLYDVWQQAGADTQGLWSRFRFPASETGYLPQAELAAARRGMDEAEYLQEFECSFAAAVRGAYYAPLLDAAEREGRIRPLPHAPELPVHTAWDLGMDDATAIWFFQVEPSGCWRIIDYYEASGEGLAHYAQVLAAKARPAGVADSSMPDGSLAGRGFVYGTHIAPHDIRVRELGTGQSRWESAAQLGIRFVMAPALSLADGIDALRRQLPRFWFDAGACAHGLKALRAYRRRWRAGAGQSAQVQAGSGPLHDWASHAADALRYAVTGFRPQQEVAPGARRARTNYDFFWRQLVRFFYAVMQAQPDRDAVFHRMQAEGLTACAMSSVPSPRLEQWRHITATEQGVLLGCYTADADQSSPGTADPAQLLACAMFSPRRGRVWEFDFTTFRHAAALAVPMARGGLAWAFKNLNCSAVMGLCPAPNRHAWRLAEQCGFRVLGRLPQACLHARKKTWVDGVLVLCTPQDLAAVETS